MILKDFYQNKLFKGSPREQASTNSTVNGHYHPCYYTSDAKRAETSFLKAIPYYITVYISFHLIYNLWELHFF